MTLLGYWSIPRPDELHHRLCSATAGLDAELLRGPGWAIASAPDPAALTSTASVADGYEPAGALVGQFFSGFQTPFSTPTQVLISALRREPNAPSLPWGRWAAAAVTDDGRSLLLSRDQLGMQRLFLAEYRGGYVFASDLDDVLRLLGRTPSVNWDFFASYLVHDAVPGSATGFDGIYELPQASTVWYREGATSLRRRHWDPFQITQRPFKEPQPDELCMLFGHCVAAWTANSDVLLSDLSGGLDSSSVTWAALQTGKDVTAVYLDDRQHGGADEWDYAARVAERLGVPVLRLPAETVLPLTPCDNAGRFDTPTVELLLAAENAARAELAPGVPSLTGTGGDHVFLSSAGNGFHLHDYLLHASGTAFLRRLAEHSRTFGVPLAVLLRGLLVDEVTRWRGGERLLARKQFHHGAPVWLAPEYRPVATVRARAAATLTERLPRLPSAKLVHAAEVAMCATSAATIATHHLRAGKQPLLYPMLSLPLVELALSAPATVLNAGGVDRAPLRDAMAGELPDEVIGRKTKGNYTGRYQRGLRQNFAVARELVVDGRLAERGMIDRTVATEHLRELALGHNDEVSPMLTLLCAELWLRSWT